MKTVFNNSMVAHVWAAQSQESGRSNNGQLYFNGRRIFSYGGHYCAGYALPRRDGSTLYLYNTDSYSITTSRHLNEVHRAIPRGQAAGVGSLTKLAEVMESGLNVWAYPEDPNGKVRPTPRAATLSDRRKVLPEIKRLLESNFPDVGVAAAILDAFGGRDGLKTAEAIARKVKRNVAVAAEQFAKRESKRTAKDARYLAALDLKESAGVIATIISSHYAPEKKLKEQSARILAATKEARRRGWTKVAADCKAKRDQVRSALRDLDAMQARLHRYNRKYESVTSLRASIRGVAGTGAKVAAKADSENLRNHGNYLKQLANDYDNFIANCGGMIPDRAKQRIASNAKATRTASVAFLGQADIERHKEQSEYRAAWLAGSKERAPYGVGRISCPVGGALLRAVDVQRDGAGVITGGVLETSHGAQVPLVHALRVFAFLKLCRAKGQAWRRNGATLRVGHFQIDSVEPNGDFVAGCHRITWAQVALVSESLGVSETVAPADTTA